MGQRKSARVRASNFAAGLKAVYIRKRNQRGGDPELRQLNSLRKAYSAPNGPELLIFGDSAMWWTNSADTRRQPLPKLVMEGLGNDWRHEAILGPLYGPRLVGAFLTALDHAVSRPEMVVVPLAVRTATSLSLQHPSFSHELESAAIRDIIARGATETHGLPRPPADALEDYDRLPAPSLYGARRTVGELRLIISATPETAWQKAVRLRHLLDYYNAEKLTPESPGIKLIADLGRQLAERDLASVAYIPPVNHPLLKGMLGAEAVEHLAGNARLIEQTFVEATDGRGRVANAVMACGREHFGDPVHVNYEGRSILASAIVDAVREVRGARSGKPDPADKINEA